MNKTIKIIIGLLVIFLIMSGVVYATVRIYRVFNKNYNVTLNPTYQSTLDENTINNLWVGTLDLAWKELEEQLKKEQIELEEPTQIANDLNASEFSKEMLSSDDYEINVEKTTTNGYKLYAKLNKKLNFLETFDNFSNDYMWTFGNDEQAIKYFGINNASPEKMNKNVEILFYNNTSDDVVDNDFAVSLKTKEGDEIILYRTDENKSFNEYYEDILSKKNTYIGNHNFTENDEILVPYVSVNGMISYEELYGKFIKDTDGMYITDVVQEINFSLNETGCNLNSIATMVTENLSASEKRYCWFKDTFIIFMKEAASNKPYFALKVDNTDILEKVDEIGGPKLLDYTILEPENYPVEDGEYKFFEDEKYEYYYSTQKTKYVIVYYKSETFEWETAEDALNNGKITIDLLDKYGIEYIRKEK